MQQQHPRVSRCGGVAVAQFHVNEKEIATAAAQLQPKTLIMVSGCWFIRSAHNVIIEGEFGAAALTMRPRKGKMSERQRCMHLLAARSKSRNFKRIYIYVFETPHAMQPQHETEKNFISFYITPSVKALCEYTPVFFIHFSGARCKDLAALNWIKPRNSIFFSGESAAAHEWNNFKASCLKRDSREE